MFVNIHGEDMAEDIALGLTNGKEFLAKFDVGKNRISGLKKFFRQYSIYEKSVVFFKFCGQSRFQVSVYDTSGIDFF